MSKANELNDARLQGMSYALRQIKSEGIEAFEREFNWRARHNFSAKLSGGEKALANAEIIRYHRMATICMAILVLHDEFGFGKKRLKQFEDRYNIKMDSIIDDYISWDDYFKLAEEITGEEFNMRWVRK